MSKYTVNFKNLIIGLVPKFLRGSFLALIWILTNGIRKLYTEHIAVRTGHWRKMQYNCQYPMLQKLLNDELDSTDRSIRVYDATGSITVPMAYPNGSSYDQLVVDGADTDTVIVHRWTEWLYRPFIVEVPSDWETDGNEMRKLKHLLDSYKFSGTEYLVKQ